MNDSGIGRLARVILVASLLATTASLCYAAKKPRWDPAYEARVGRETAAEVDQSYNRVDDPAAQAKVQRMVDTIAANTPRPEVRYDVRLVQEKEPGPEPEVNAFSLPGGIVYVTKGLLDTVESDHELAGVLAHEIAHNVTYDGLEQARRASNIFKGEVAAVLGAVLVGGLDNELWSQVMQAGMLVRYGILGGYSINMETQADAHAVDYMLNTPWTPVGLLTFMERLAADEMQNPVGEQGVFQTHPLSSQRVEQLIKQLRNEGVDINRRETTRWARPEVAPGEMGGRPVQKVVWNGETIYTCEDAQRAAQIANGLGDALAQGAGSYSFTTRNRGGVYMLLASGEPIIEVSAADASLAGVAPAKVAESAQRAIQRALVREQLARRY